MPPVNEHTHTHKLGVTQPSHPTYSLYLHPSVPPSLSMSREETAIKHTNLKWDPSKKTPVCLVSLWTPLSLKHTLSAVSAHFSVTEGQQERDRCSWIIRSRIIPPTFDSDVPLRNVNNFIKIGNVINHQFTYKMSGFNKNPKSKSFH